MLGHTIRVWPTWHAFWCCCLTCPDLLLSVLTFVALLVLFLAKVTITRLVHCQFHVMVTPVPYFLANPFVFWFVVLGWCLLPFFVLLLKVLLWVVFAVLATIPWILTCIGSLFSVDLSLSLISIELDVQLGGKLEVLELFELSLKGYTFLLVGRLHAPLSTDHE